MKFLGGGQNHFWIREGDLCKRIGIVAILTILFNYFYFIVNGYGGPDAVSEGVWYYIGGEHAMRLSRWFIPYLNTFFGKNVVIPLVIVTFYGLFISVAAIFLFKLWNIKSAGFQILTACSMICFPVVTRQYAYLYMALAYAISFLMVVLAAWFIRKRRILSFFVSTFCLLVMLGSYQAYIGAATAVVMICFISDMLQERRVLESLKDVGLYAISGVAAVGFDLLVAEAVRYKNNLEVHDRVASASVMDIFENLGFSLKASYSWFFTYFQSDVLSRDKLYLTLFAVIIVLTIVNVVILIRKKEILHSVCLIVSIVLIPLAMNSCVVVFPRNGIYDVMRYQYVLIIPLVFLLLGNMPKSIFNNIMQWGVYAIVFLLITGYTITSNASAICYRLAYESTHDQAVSMLSRVYELEGYDADSSPIVLGGGTISYLDTYYAFPQLFRYSALEAGPVFWSGDNGLRNGRYFYFLNYLGVNPMWLTPEQYHYITNTEIYISMPCWPEEGSVQMIDGYAVIKMEE